MAAAIIMTGDKALDAKLAALPEKAQKKIARAALGRAMTLIRKAARRAAPVGPTGTLRDSIGKRFKKAIGGITQAKAGINVGKAGSKRTVAPHGHLVALGSKDRTREKIGGKFARYDATAQSRSTGTMPANEFFKEAVDSVEGQAQALMMRVILEKLDKEVSRW